MCWPPKWAQKVITRAPLPQPWLLRDPPARTTGPPVPWEDAIVLGGVGGVGAPPHVPHAWCRLSLLLCTEAGWIPCRQAETSGDRTLQRLCLMRIFTTRSLMSPRRRPSITNSTCEATVHRGTQTCSVPQHTWVLAPPCRNASLVIGTRCAVPRRLGSHPPAHVHHKSQPRGMGEGLLALHGPSATDRPCREQSVVWPQNCGFGNTDRWGMSLKPVELEGKHVQTKILGFRPG